MRSIYTALALRSIIFALTSVKKPSQDQLIYLCASETIISQHQQNWLAKAVPSKGLRFCHSLTMDVNTDYIDNNYVWQRRIQMVFKTRKTSVAFASAEAIGFEYNPAFERQEKISVKLVTNSAILDIHDFVKSITKSASFHLLDILNFNFDLGLDENSSLFFAYASKVYSSVKSFKDHFRVRPQQLQAKLQDIFLLPERTLENADSISQKREFEPPFDLKLDNERKSDPFLVSKFGGRTVQLRMDSYPMCKKEGVTFVLRPSNAPAQKLSAELLTVAMMLEMLDFARILAGSYCQMLKELISHNFGEVYEPCYLTGQVKALYQKRVSQPTRALRLSFLKESFKFMSRKVKKPENILKRPCNFDGDIEIVPEKDQSEKTQLNTNSILEDEEMSEASYMCPVEFEPDFEASAGPENETNENEMVDVELVVPGRSVREKSQKDYVPPKKKPKHPYCGFMHMRKLKNAHTVPLLQIYGEDTLPMHQKTLKQKEWTRRSYRIKEIFNKGIQDMFSRCTQISLDFNVGSGRKQNLDMNLLTNHTLYEVNRFSVHLSKSVSVFLMDIMENNFNLCFQDEGHERNFMSYLLGKERPLLNHAHNHTFMGTPIIFPEGYNVVDLTRESYNKESADGVSEEDLCDEFPFCKDLNLNLWSLEERPGTKVDLSDMTNGALLEIVTFSRRLASNPRDLFNDVLEHNFDVDLQDPATEDSKGLDKWFATNKMLLKKPLCLLRAHVWLTEEISLKQYSMPKQQIISEMVSSVPGRRGQERTYKICEEIGLELNVSSKSPMKQKLSLHMLTRGALFEVHHFVKNKCNRYVPALYEILDYNFDLSSQRHRKVELAWSIAAQVLAMVQKSERGERYMQQVFELPFESKEDVCKEEPEEQETEELGDDDDVVYVQKLIPVDIAVEIE